MKICVLGNPNSPHVIRWVRYFARRGCALSLIGHQAPRRPIPEDVDFYNLAAKINVRKVRYLAWAWQVRQLVRKIQPAVLHAHFVDGAGWLGAASGFHPYLLTAHGSDLLLLPYRPWLHQRLSLWALRQADHLTCVSEDLVQQASYYGVPQEQMDLLYLGVDTSVFYPIPDPRDIRERLGLDHDRPVVLSPRSIKPVYNPLDIARAIPLIYRHVPTAQFLVFTFNAVPHLLKQFRSIVQEGGASPSVRYISEISHDQLLADYYRAADVIISVPSSDGTPKSVQEAMACGTPVVASDIAALRKWVRHEQEGLLVPVGDAAAISEAVVHVLVDRELWGRLSTNAVHLIRRHADSRIWMARAEDLYQRLAVSKSAESERGSNYAEPR